MYVHGPDVQYLKKVNRDLFRFASTLKGWNCSETIQVI